MKTRIAAVALVALLALTGCAGGADTAGDERTAPAATESEAPLTAETPEVSEADADSAEQAFLDDVREKLPTPTSIPDASDEQLLAAGMEACELIRGGTDPGDVRLVDGEQPNGADIYADSSAIMNSALSSLCPELI